MNERYWMDVKAPMFHLAERNLLLAIFREQTKDYYGRERIDRKTSCKVKLVISKRLNNQKHARAVFEMTMQRGEGTEELPRRLMRMCRIKLRKGRLILSVQVYREEPLGEAEVTLAKMLVVDMAETLKLFANGDCFMMIGVDNLIVNIAAETGVEDPVGWIKAYLTPPIYMVEKPEVRRYYRLYNDHLSHAHSQILLERKKEDLIEVPV